VFWASDTSLKNHGKVRYVATPFVRCKEGARLQRLIDGLVVADGPVEREVIKVKQNSLSFPGNRFFGYLAWYGDELIHTLSSGFWVGDR